MDFLSKRWTVHIGFTLNNLGNHFVSSSSTLTVLLCLSCQNNLLTNCYWSSCLIISFAPFKIFPDLVCYSTRISLKLIMQTTETSSWVLPNSVTKTTSTCKCIPCACQISFVSADVNCICQITPLLNTTNCHPTLLTRNEEF